MEHRELQKWAACVQRSSGWLSGLVEVCVSGADLGLAEVECGGLAPEPIPASGWMSGM